MIFALLNTIASQARMGYLTILFCAFMFYFVFVFIEGSILKPTIWLFSGLGALSATIIYLYYSGNAFLVQAFSRWLVLAEQVDEGGNRVGQIKTALGGISGFYEHLFGISNLVKGYRDLFIEVDPVNILVIYGIAGFILQYLLVACLAVYFCFRLRDQRCSKATHVLLICSLVTLVDYQFFSLAYYFYRELYVGLFPWILMGAVIGIVERELLEAKQGPARGFPAGEMRFQPT
jgi:hypothetical protein